MGSVVAELSVVRASGSRESVQFDFSGKPEGWVCSNHSSGAMGRVFGLDFAAKPKWNGELARLHAGGRELLISSSFAPLAGHGLLLRRKWQH